MKILRFFFSLLLVPLTIELAARIDDLVSEGVPFLADYSHDSLYEFGTDGKRGKPNAKYLKWELNNLGFRGENLVAGSRRIAVVGSSETFGLYESKGNEWPQQFQKLLNSRSDHPKFQVVNFAYPGLLLSTFERRLEEFLGSTDPEVLIIYPSPTGYLYRNVKEPSKLEIVNPPTEAKFQLRISTRLMEILKKITPSAVRNVLLQWQLERAVSESEQVFETVPEEYIKVFKADLERIINKLSEKSVNPVLVTHATYFGNTYNDQDKSIMVAWRKFYPMLSEQGLLDLERRFNQVLKELAAEKKILLVDLARQMPAGSEYFADAVHFTDKGSEFAAKSIMEELYAN